MMLSADPLVIGIDVGTSGVRAVAMDAAGDDPRPRRAPQWRISARTIATPRSGGRRPGRRSPPCLPPPTRRASAPSPSTAPPARWSRSARAARRWRRGSMYNDPVDDAEILASIRHAAPADKRRARADLRPRQADPPAGDARRRARHPPGRLDRRAFFRPLRRERREQCAEDRLRPGGAPLAATGSAARRRRRELLPEVVEPGSPIGRITAEMPPRDSACRADVVIVAGTTDGCASFLATGASEPGEAVTALGSTLTLKLLSDTAALRAGIRPLQPPASATRWLAGGASNTGGAVLRAFLRARGDRDALRQARSASSRPASTTTRCSSRASASRSTIPPTRPASSRGRRTTRPSCKGCWKASPRWRRSAIAASPSSAARALENVRTVGGGAKNAAWTAIRARMLGVPLLPAASEEAAAGTARLALQGARTAGLL